MKYKDQLKTSAWLRKKFETMDRDNFVCSKCLCDNSESQLEVHHIAYGKNIMAWDYPDYFLVTLCRECHQKEHDENATRDKTKIRKWIVNRLTDNKHEPLTDNELEYLSKLF